MLGIFVKFYIMRDFVFFKHSIQLAGTLHGEIFLRITSDNWAGSCKGFEWLRHRSIKGRSDFDAICRDGHLQGIATAHTKTHRPDVICVHWAAADLQQQPGDYVPRLVDPAALIKDAAAGKLGIAVGAYETREKPIYAVMPAALVEKLASKLP